MRLRANVTLYPLSRNGWAAASSASAAARNRMCASDSPPARRHLSTGKQVLFSLIIVVGLIVAAEGAVRIWALYFRTSYERYNRHTGRLELVPNIMTLGEVQKDQALAMYREHLERLRKGKR